MNAPDALATAPGTGLHFARPDAPPVGVSFARATYEVARKEVLQHLRTKRLLIVGALLLATTLLITVVLPLAFGLEFLREISGVESGGLQNFVIVFFLTGFLVLSGYFFITLLPIVLTADAVCSEWSSRTIFLLLSKPVSRVAFLLGKFAGSAATVAVTVSLVLILDYGLLSFILPEAPGWGDAGRFVGALGIIVLGILAWTSVSLLFSTLTRSTAVSMILSVASWIVVFPILGSLDRIISIVRFGFRSFSMKPEDAGVGWSLYLSPSDSMHTASQVLLPQGAAHFLGVATPMHVVGSVIALVVQTAVFLALALWVVRRRNFE